MAEANGYVLNIARDRRAALLSSDEEVVAESVLEFKHPRSHPLVCFVGFEDGAITHIALGRRGQRAATGLRRLNLPDLTKLQPAVSHVDVLDLIPNSVRRHVAARFETGGLLPPSSFEAVVDAVRKLLPESNALLDRFSATRRALIAEIPLPVKRTFAYQKETVATALEMARIDRRQLQGWQPRLVEGRPVSFLDGLPQARLHESQMILNDLQHFPGFELVGKMKHSTAVFVNRRATLTVIMADTLPLEKQLGADLIYFNEAFHSFVVVQYKAMEQESGASIFRLPNVKLTEELARMDAILTTLALCPPDAALNGFRLAENPVFIKLCPRIVFDPDDSSLVKGMYLPLGYWRRLESDPSLKGPRKGVSVTFDNVGRYFDNSTFAGLVAGGWVGTTMHQSEILREAIREIVESGRTVTIAIKQSNELDESVEQPEEWDDE